MFSYHKYRAVSLFVLLNVAIVITWTIILFRNPSLIGRSQGKNVDATDANSLAQIDTSLYVPTGLVRQFNYNPFALTQSYLNSSIIRPVVVVGFGVVLFLFFFFWSCGRSICTPSCREAGGCCICKQPNRILPQGF